SNWLLTISQEEAVPEFILDFKICKIFFQITGLLGAILLDYFEKCRVWQLEITLFAILATSYSPSSTKKQF
ncbi:MAG TPA: hypothetical protein VLL95_06580, partial [Phnomibacter sp.]|nr:hypothetical protein [Phnomibacter sp.]